jgi:hypothetical protein
MLQPADCHDLNDARLESALGSYTLAELEALQDTLQWLHREGFSVDATAVALQENSADTASWLTLGGRMDDAKITVLLGALSVAIAWQTYRARSAPSGDIRRAIERIDAGVLYTLPIPRHKPCFCGSEARYRDCHGRPPVMDMIA